MNSDDLLSEAEVDALLDAVSDGSMSSVLASGPMPQEHVREYDFSAPNRVITGMAPTLTAINDRFSVRFRQTVYGMTQQLTDIVTEPVGLVALDDYLSALEAPSSLHIARASPLRGSLLVVLESHFLTCLVESFFGSRRKQIKMRARSDFSTAERRLASRFVNAALADLGHAWRPVMPLDFENVAHESNPEYLNLNGASQTEAMVISVFKLALEAGEGSFHVLLPYTMLEPLRARLVAPIQHLDEDHEEDFSGAVMDGIADAQITVNAMLSQTEISIDDLMHLKAGDVIAVEPSKLVTLDVDGIPIYTGSYGSVGNFRALKITGKANR